MTKYIKNEGFFDALKAMAVGERSFAIQQHPTDPDGCTFNIMCRLPGNIIENTDFSFSARGAIEVRDMLIEMFPLPKKDG